MTNWHVGQKVVCIRDLSACGLQVELVPQVGVIYTIRSIEWGLRPLDRVFFRFEEIVNETMIYASGKHECSFGCDNFRPVKETSIETFRALLEPLPEFEKA